MIPGFERPSFRPGDFIAAAADAPQAIKDAARLGRGVVVGVGGVTDTSALTAAFAATGGGRRVFLYGTFTPTTTYTISAKDYVYLDGQATIYGIDSGNPILHITGSRTAAGVTLPGTSLAQGTNALTISGSFANGTTPAAGGGEYWALCSAGTAGQPWGNRVGENFYATVLKSESFSSNTFRWKVPYRETYQLNNFTYQLYKYNTIKNPQVRNIRFIMPGGPGNPVTTATNRCRGLSISYAENPLVELCYFAGTYGREGVAIWESINITIQDCTAEDVNDLAATSGQEAYPFRIMGCEGGRVRRCKGQGSRHLVEVNGGQNGYGLGTTTSPVRPISYDIVVEDVHAEKTWGAAVGDHPGCSNTVYANIFAKGCSGAIFARGKEVSIYGKVVLEGGTHENGPYSTAQSNDHCIWIGEQLKNADGSDNNSARSGWCGTNLVIDAQIIHDMTGNAAPLATTSHTVHIVHPLDNAYINIKGKMKPTGSVVHAVGDYDRDSTIIVNGADCSASFNTNGTAPNINTNGAFVVLKPRATVAASTGGQYVDGMTVDVSGRAPGEEGAVIIAGSILASEVSSVNRITARVRSLGPDSSATTPIVVLGNNVNGTGGYHPLTIIKDSTATHTNMNNFLSVATGALSIYGGAPAYAVWDGINVFAGGEVKMYDTPTPATGMVRDVYGLTGTSTSPTNQNPNVMYLHRVKGTGKRFQVARAHVTGVPVGGSAMALMSGAYADDGTGQKPTGAALVQFPDIDLGTTTGEKSSAALATAWQEPVGWYWRAVVYKEATTASTKPAMAGPSNFAYLDHSGPGNGSGAASPRCWSQSGVTGTTLPTIGTLTIDQSTRPGVVFVAL